MDQEPYIDLCASHIDKLLDVYRKLCPSIEEPETEVADLLCDIMHYCERAEIVFDPVLARAKSNFQQLRRSDG